MPDQPTLALAWALASFDWQVRPRLHPTSVFELTAVDRRPVDILRRPLAVRIDQQLGAQNVRLPPSFDRRTDAADPAALQRFLVVDDQTDDQGGDTGGATLEPDAAVTPAAVAVDVERSLTAALATATGLRRPFAHPTDVLAVQAIGQRSFMTADRADPFFVLLGAGPTEVLIRSDLLRHRLDEVAPDAGDLPAEHLIAEAADRIAVGSVGGDHPLLATDAALPRVPAMTQALRTDRVSGGIMRGHHALALALATWYARLAMPLVTPAAGQLAGLLVPVDVWPFLAADAAGLPWTRSSLAPLAQRFVGQLVRKNGLLFLTLGANADHHDRPPSLENRMSCLDPSISDEKCQMQSSAGTSQL